MKTNKQTMIAATLLTLVIAGWLVFTGAMSNKAKAAEHRRASGVVVLVARADFTTTPRNLVVVVSSSSQGAPTVSQNASLAQALDDLFTNGFQIQHIEETSYGLNYTLV